MKKIVLTGAVMITWVFITNTFAQNQDLSLTSEKKELRHEKREINEKERMIRKEEKVSRQNEVSYMTKEQFRIDFPEAINPVFSVGKNFEEVSYAFNGIPFIAYYDKESKLVGTITEKQMNDLPLTAQKTIKIKYLDKGYSVVKMILFDDNEMNTRDMFIYDQQFNDADLYFLELTKAGKTLILQVKKSGDVLFFKSM